MKLGAGFWLGCVAVAALGAVYDVGVFPAVVAGFIWGAIYSILTRA